jgi:hypothetical protein
MSIGGGGMATAVLICWNKLIEAVRQHAPGVKLLKPMRTQGAA